MIYILEGNELNGKSTVAKLLSDKLGYEIIKGSSFEQSKCSHDELFSKFLNMVVGNDNIIMDRFIYSNLIYGNMYKDFAVINDGEKRLIESLMELSNTKVIYLHADVETLKERYSKRGDEYVPISKLETINEKYEELLQETNYPYTRIDTAKHNPEEVADIILNLK
jgi:thymidylate kinase